MTLVTEGTIVRCLAATDGHPLVLDNIQRGCGQGPCLDAATSRQIFGIADLQAETRWPRFTAKAVASTPVLLVKPAKQQNDSIEAVARELVSGGN